jgi:hypothetical protein
MNRSAKTDRLTAGSESTGIERNLRGLKLPNYGLSASKNDCPESLALDMIYSDTFHDIVLLAQNKAQNYCKF